MITFLFATRNRHKVRELRRLFRGFPVRFLPADRFPDLPAVREDAATFRANAAKKAVVVSRRTALPVLSEDSGLQVRSLGGRPGVHSARYAGPAQDDRANVSLLLKELSGVPAGRRQARFVCVMAVAVGGRLIRTFQGECSGTIAFKRAGRTGFGYDPVFIPLGGRRTLAQLGARRKDAFSHRGKVSAQLRKWLAKKDLSGNPGG